jgi:hypothetical protein
MKPALEKNLNRMFTDFNGKEMECVSALDINKETGEMSFIVANDEGHAYLVKMSFEEI